MNLLTRVLKYVGPRDLPMGEDFASGFARQIANQTQTITRWHLADLEATIIAADTGNMRLPGKLWRAMRRDGYLSGLLSSRFDGLVQLPLKITSDDSEIRTSLARDFRTVFPTAELAQLFADGFGLGAGVGEFVQVSGSLPILKRLNPEYLFYFWAEDRWRYQSVHGLLDVNPGDGRWVLFCPGGASEPWAKGMWPSLARAYIAKEHAFYLRENYSSKLANAARVAVSPQGASAGIKLKWFQQVAAWGINTVFGVPPGYDVKLIESNGRGYDVFQDTIRTANEEFTVNTAGQLVTTTGGAGFQNAAIFSNIRTDLIQSDGDKGADFLATQGIPVYLREVYGEGALETNTRAAWDVTPPSDLTRDASAMNTAAIAIAAMNEVLAPLGKRVDVEDMARRFNVPVRDLEEAVAMAMKDEQVVEQGKRVAAAIAHEDRLAELAARRAGAEGNARAKKLESRIVQLEHQIETMRRAA